LQIGAILLVDSTLLFDLLARVKASISHQAKCPSWEVMCRIKEIFFGDDECVMQLHPPKADWVNNHKYCLHLWKPINGEVIPRPPAIFVGLPGVDHTDIAKHGEAIKTLVRDMRIIYDAQERARRFQKRQ